MMGYDLEMSAAKIKQLEARIGALEEMMRERDHAEFVRSIQQGVAEVDRGESLPAREAFAKFEAKHGIKRTTKRGRR
jgi:hypothetical protein